ncbi:hypothetical protein A5M85_07305 [Cellulophaga lytica]|uniref:polysaccharide lyase family 8 super-sandwich domain-containing protein n=1 Tax=Cellulophaga lytica TaxID=979 RepID=UPI00095055E7|nr:polysaccharide lyase family 8 super-sandwich domain-containing protein [Cellulophaga lytica]APU10096.1 hypothetical protein A5M85_07305 [Cellulophaga lytica]
MKKKLLILVFILISFKIFSQNPDNIIECLQEIIPKNSLYDIQSLDKWITNQNADGSWDEFKYGTLSEIDSDENYHLYRILVIAKEVSDLHSQNFNNIHYVNTVIKGLKFWLKSNTIDINWWDNLIKFPKMIGETLIVMRDVPNWCLYDYKGLEVSLLNSFNPYKIKDLSSYGRGSNMLDFALHYLYRGALTSDINLISNTINFVLKNIETNIQEDLSFHQHGKQMHIASYGYEFSKAVVNIVYCFKSSLNNLNNKHPSLNRIFNFINNTQLNSYRGMNWDYNVVGRGISRLNGTYLKDDFFLMKKRLGLIENIDIRTDKYPRLHKHFWKSDYTQHIREDYTFNVRAISNRTIETETRRGENLKGNYLCYGSYFLSLNGTEYKSIIPVWDWSMIPGITLNRTNHFPIRSNQKKDNYGKTSFVGGVSDGEYGATGFKVNMDSLKVNKSWFFFDNQIVCLGSGIESSSYTALKTTVNQCKGDYEFSVFKKNGNVLKRKKSYSGKPGWVVHNKIGYYFYGNENVEASLGTVESNLRNINAKEKDTLISEKVFKLWINHQKFKRNYAYIVVPNMSLDSKLKVPEITILENNSSIQAVRNDDLNIVQVVFYDTTELVLDFIKIKVSNPCILMLKEGNIISVSDPTQELDKLNVNVEYINSNVGSKLVYFFKDTDRGASLKKRVEEGSKYLITKK